MNRFRPTLMGAVAAALVLTTTTALAGSGVGGVFNLGQVNTVDAQTSLNGNPGGNPLLKVTSTGTAAAVRGVATTGIGTNGVSTSGVGQQGLSTSGTGTLGTHGGTTGTAPGVQGETNSTDPGGAGVVGKNNGGGPGLKAIVNAGAPPLSVNSGVKVANLNADLLDGLDSPAFQKRVSGTCTAGSAVKAVNADGTVTCEPVGGGGVWSLTGNTGTTPGTNFLGTTDNQALELRVNGQRAVRLEPNVNGPNVIGGYSGSAVLPGAVGSTIAGGGGAGLANLVSDNLGTIGGGGPNSAGDFDAGSDPTSANAATVAGGQFNYAGASAATVGGGESNQATHTHATIGGGTTNTADGDNSTVGGGVNNHASGPQSTVAGGGVNGATGSNSTVAGGGANFATGALSMVPGGGRNTAGGDYSFAAGRQAQATQNGAFVWADDFAVDLTAPAANTFTVRANGGIWLGRTSSPAIQAGHFIDTSTFGYLSDGGVWTDNSDRTKKHDFQPLDKHSVLEKVARMPITSWSYKAEKPSVRHIGPMAQDFYKAFGLGLDNKHITTIDEGGVALAAIQSLYRENQALERRVERLERAWNESQRISQGRTQR